MANTQTDSDHVSEVDSALLDAELFMKYRSPERAMKRLRTALERSPRSIPVRERLREIAATHKHADEAARQCLALASLYIERDEFELAYDRLLEAKQMDPRINIASGLDAIRRARRPDLQAAPAPATSAATPQIETKKMVLGGDLSVISIFDAVQVIENSRLTGTLRLNGDAQSGVVFFNEGQIVDADSAGKTGDAGFRHIVEITSGSFEFERSDETFKVEIKAPSNTNLILDTLRQLDEANL